LALLALASGRGPWPATPAEAAPIVTLAGDARSGALAVAHAGVGSSPSVADGVQAAADAALAALHDGASPLDAAIVGTVVMEDDPRFNAGTGANIRLDGKTIQMDASLMTSEGRFAAVGVIERVKNPIRVVRAVLDTPHLFLAGEGATRFAHKMSFEDVVPTCAEAEAKYAERLTKLVAAMGRPDTVVFDWPRHWNFPNPLPPALEDFAKGGDTVATIARGRDGRFAATLSTGGTSITLSGRVGDVPIYGAGLFAGPSGAVACTGHGEEIIKRFVARSVYDRMTEGVSARDAVSEAVAAFPDASEIGVIAIDANGWGVAANKSMAYGAASE
jgi:isoaspartyl peptidase/L-asparaginase-like protein (Ntn-hydrolase superfamily)